MPPASPLRASAVPAEPRPAAAWLTRTLAPCADQGSPATLARHLLEDLLGLRRPWPEHPPLDAAQRARLASAAQRLLDGEPLAYVTGRAHFLDLVLAVDRRVLIPRPETEELADAALRAWRGTAPRVLDVGTGSGCLALALARHLPGAGVTAVDLHADALALAAANARALDLPVRFLQGDFLDSSFRNALPEVDLVVSNPPYIDPSEAASLADHVRAHEPAAALFAPPGDPLAFYRALVAFTAERVPAGDRPRAFLETSAVTARGALALAREAGLAAELRADLSGRDRILMLR